MPFITVECSKNQKGDKTKLSEVLTKKASEILGINENLVITVIKENDIAKNLSAVITVEFNKPDKETKAKLAEVLTKETSDILEINQSPIATIIKENSLDNLALGGKLLSDSLASK